MPASADFPLRLRLHGGRNIHAAAERPLFSETRVFTACGYVKGPTDHLLPSDTPNQVSCRACARKTK